MRNKTKWLSSTTGCLIVAAIWAMLAVPSSALAKKGGKGGGNTEIRLARIYFLDSPRIKRDGMECWDPVFDETWDYWDFRDPDVAADPECVGCRIDVSGGGRVFFFTATERPRWLTLDLTPTAEDIPFNEPPFDENGLGTGPDIDSVYDETIDGLPVNPDTFVDNVKGTIALPNMFKKTASRQAFDLTIRRFNPETGGWPPAGWSLHSIDDLYIEETSDPDVRILTTRNPQTGEHDSRWFELWQSGETAGSYSTVGIYSIRMTWVMRIIPAP